MNKFGWNLSINFVEGTSKNRGKQTVYLDVHRYIICTNDKHREVYNTLCMWQTLENILNAHGEKERNIYIKLNLIRMGHINAPFLLSLFYPLKGTIVYY